MSFRPTLLFALPIALIGAPDGRADTGRADPSPAAAERPAPVAASDQRIQLAQKDWAGRDRWQGAPPQGGEEKAPDNAGEEEGVQRKRGRDPGRQQGNEQQQGRDKAIQDRQDAIDAQQLQREQARQKALQDRQKAIEGQQLQREQAKQKAIELQQQQRIDAQQAREKAIQDRQNAVKDQQLQREQAKQKAIELQQQQRIDAQQARDRAIQDRQNAAKDQQLQREQAKQKALQDQQNAAREQQLRREQAKQKAIQDRQNAVNRGNIPGQPPRYDGPGNWAGQRDTFDPKAADNEFNRARDRARDFTKGGPQGGDNRGRDTERWQADSARKFEDIRKGRRERAESDGRRREFVEPDNRVIVREKDRAYIRHNEYDRFKKTSREVRRERRKDGLTMIVTAGLAGALIYSLMDDDGRLVRRSRRYDDGREVVLINNEGYYDYRDGRYDRDDDYDSYVELPPPRVRIPQDDYIVDYGSASQEDIYDALMAPPVERLDRGYSLDEVRRSYSVLERMRRVDLDAINFNFGAWDVGQDQYPKLERVANAMQRILKRSPDEIFLIEGHTDAVGSDIDNLSLSDRRAESVAIILSDYFDIPPENLTTQGYGEQYLKVLTEEPSRINRRVSMRRITPLLSRRDSARYRD